MIILVLSLVYGCGSKSDSNSGTNNDNTNPSLKWPAESMGDLPVVKGTITGVTHGDNNLFCTVTFKEITIDDVEYNTEKQGLVIEQSIASETKFKDVSTIIITYMEKEENQ